LVGGSGEVTGKPAGARLSTRNSSGLVALGASLHAHQEVPGARSVAVKQTRSALPLDESESGL
jgi:hypothetical protein